MAQDYFEGSVFAVTVEHPELGLSYHLSGKEHVLVKRKAEMIYAGWVDAWTALESRQGACDSCKNEKVKAQLLTNYAQQDLSQVRTVITHPLSIGSDNVWKALHYNTEYTEKKPTAPVYGIVSSAPERTEACYRMSFIWVLIGLIAPGSKKKAKYRAQTRYVEAYEAWEAEKQEIERSNAEKEKAYKEALRKWQLGKTDFVNHQNLGNHIIEERRIQYARCHPDAVVDYADLVLHLSSYPYYFPKTFDVAYNKADKRLIVNYQLPALRDIPIVSSVQVGESGECEEVYLCAGEQQALYDQVVVSIIIRSMYELFTHDDALSIDSIAFNGWVRWLHQKEEYVGCIASIVADRDYFMQVIERESDAFMCFQQLGGQGKCFYQYQSVTPYKYENKTLQKVA